MAHSSWTSGIFPNLHSNLRFVLHKCTSLLIYNVRTLFYPQYYTTTTIFWFVTDVNECALNNGHGPCQGECTNWYGGFSCGCDTLPGTKLDQDERACRDVDECHELPELPNFGCSHTCLNSPGSAFCVCPTGYELDSDWKTCQGKGDFFFK
jgi:hypothetical protein